MKLRTFSKNHNKIIPKQIPLRIELQEDKEISKERYISPEEKQKLMMIWSDLVKEYTKSTT